MPRGYGGGAGVSNSLSWRGAGYNAGGYGGGANASQGSWGDYGTGGYGSGAYGGGAGSSYGSGGRGGYGSHSSAGGFSAPPNAPTGPRNQSSNPPANANTSQARVANNAKDSTQRLLAQLYYKSTEFYKPPEFDHQDQEEVLTKGMGMDDKDPNCLRCGHTKSDGHARDGTCGRDCCRCGEEGHPDAEVM